MNQQLPDGHVEFLSDAWIEEARRHLRSAVPDVSFSFCESFADPPPGIDGAWHVRIADGKVEAGPGEAADTDLRVDGDYQAMLAIVQTVYAAGRESIGRSYREMTHRHGPHAMRMRGETPAPMHRVLSGLHDHMAARTIENPHLDHRVRRLGLDHHIAELADHGRTVVERALTEAFADELRERVEYELGAAHTPEVGGLLDRHRVFEEIALHPLARTAAESVLGPGVVLGSVRGGRRTAAAAGSGGDPRKESGSPLVVAASWVLDATAGDAAAGGLPKGSLVLSSGGRSPRDPGGRRTVGLTVDVTYSHASVAPADDFGSIGEGQLRRNPPAFRTLLRRDSTPSAAE